MERYKILDGDALAALRALQEPGEPDVVSEVTRMFLEDSSKYRDAAERAIAAHDAAALAVAAHRLRGSAASLGLERLQRRAADIECVAAAGGPAEWPERLLRMLEALDQACAGLRDGGRAVH